MRSRLISFLSFPPFLLSSPTFGRTLSYPSFRPYPRFSLFPLPSAFLPPPSNLFAKETDGTCDPQPDFPESLLGLPVPGSLSSQVPRVRSPALFTVYCIPWHFSASHLHGHCCVLHVALVHNVLLCLDQATCADLTGNYVFTGPSIGTTQLTQSGCQGSSSFWSYTVNGLTATIANTVVTGSISGLPGAYIITWSNGYVYTQQVLEFEHGRSARGFSAGRGPRPSTV